MEQATESLPIAATGVVERTHLPPAHPYESLSYAELKPTTAAPKDWLWHGYLLPGAVTLLTSLWKSGKSTLLSVLLSRMQTGGELAGLAVRAGRAVIVSEEPPELWWERGLNLALDGHVRWICRPFRGKPTADQWLGLIAQIGDMHDRQPVDLVAIDPLASLAAMRTENDAAEILKAVSPLQSLTSRGMSVLLSHHPSKGKVLAAQAARGSGALSAFVDILLEMRPVNRRNAQDRRRLLRAYSRYAATPPTWVIEWTADGRDYRSLGPSGEPDFAHGWPVLRTLLENADRPLTRKQILRAWPDSAAMPASQTLWRWLDQTVRDGLVLQQGCGSRKEPYTYHTPGMIERWQAKLMERLLGPLHGEAERVQPPLTR